MISESLLLEFLSRVSILENRTSILENKTSILENVVKDVQEDIESQEEHMAAKILDSEVTDSDAANPYIKITKSTSRDYVINKLRAMNTDWKVEKANRADGSGIVIIDSNTSKKLKCKFYHSKSYQNNFPAGWHTVNVSHLNDTSIAYYIFNVEYNGTYSTYIFSRNDLLNFTNNKLQDQNNNYHFYFNIKDGQVIECRDNIITCDVYLENWSSIKI